MIVPMQNSVESEVKTVFSLLKENRFVVPWHQRYYDWNEENVQDLLDDLSAAYDERAPIYFLGTIMLIKGQDNRWEINDGQQRLITLSLLFARLRQMLSDMGESARAKNAMRVIFDIEEHDSPSSDEIKNLKPRISPPATDAPNYGLLIQCCPIGRNGKMVSAAKCIEEFLHHKSSNEPKWVPRFLDYIIKKLQVIELRVGHGIDPNGIFETLNFRGKSLEDVDLMRNYFYSFFGHEDDSHKRKTVYEQMEGIYKKTLSSSKALGEYMRCHLQAIYGYLQSNRLYSEVKKQIQRTETSPKEEVYSLVTNLAKDHRIGIYRLLKNPLSNTDLAEDLREMSLLARKSRNKRQIENYLKDLQQYKVTHPVLFALLCRYVEANDIDKKTLAPFVYACCKYISSFVTRVSHIQNFQPSHYEKAFGDLAKSIMTQNCNTKEKFFDILVECDEKTRVISDKQYVESLRNSRRISQSKGKELLFAIAEHQRRAILVDAKQCTLEHILPQSQSHISGWPAFDKESHRDMVNCLGNLTLLSASENPRDRSTNASFSAKKEIYQNSDFKITKDICQHADWSPTAIRKRQVVIAKAAAHIWDFDGMNGKGR